MLHCYIDQNGFRIAGLVPALGHLANFLEADVQGSVESCDLWLHWLEDVEQGRCESFEASGNANEVLIEAKSTTITNLYEDALPPLRLKTTEFRDAIVEWRAFIELHQI